jgi:hypothetical protein
MGYGGIDAQGETEQQYYSSTLGSASVCLRFFLSSPLTAAIRSDIWVRSFLAQEPRHKWAQIEDPDRRLRVWLKR